MYKDTPNLHMENWQNMWGGKTVSEAALSALGGFKLFQSYTCASNLHWSTQACASYVYYLTSPVALPWWDTHLLSSDHILTNPVTRTLEKRDITLKSDPPDAK